MLGYPVSSLQRCTVESRTLWTDRSSYGQETDCLSVLFYDGLVGFVCSPANAITHSSALFESYFSSLACSHIKYLSLLPEDTNSQNSICEMNVKNMFVNKILPHQSLFVSRTCLEIAICHCLCHNTLIP